MNWTHDRIYVFERLIKKRKRIRCSQHIDGDGVFIPCRSKRRWWFGPIPDPAEATSKPESED